MADLTREVAQSHREAPHQTGYSHRTDDDLKLLTPPLHLIARPRASVVKYNPAQPRDDQGQWTGTGLPTLPKVEGILDAIGRPDGGFTYHAVTGEQPTTGFALSIHRDREAVMDDSQATVVALARYAAKNWGLLKESGNFIGGWHNPDDGKVYLDVSTVVETAEEADRLARAADQIAYFDLVKGQSIKIGTRHAAKADSPSHGATRRPAHAGGSDRPVQVVDGPRSHAGGDRAGEAGSQGGTVMALKMLIKADPEPKPLHEVPPPAKHPEYASILKGEAKKPVDK